uniref:Ig-like domain-containing protein n=1 Tax=Acinetobacter sp. YH16038 TaxID=2601183 RepID=UPI001C555F04
GENGLTPEIGSNGNWWIGTEDTGVSAIGEISISDAGTWVINGTDTGIKAQGTDGKDGTDGQDGENGLTPEIGSNGNWWIGTEDTGVSAIGEISISDAGTWVINGTDTGIKAQGAAGDKGDKGDEGTGLTDIIASVQVTGKPIANTEITEQDLNAQGKVNLTINLTPADIANGITGAQTGDKVLVGTTLYTLTTDDIANGSIKLLVSVVLGENSYLVEAIDADGKIDREIISFELINTATDKIGTIELVDDVLAPLDTLNKAEIGDDQRTDIKIKLGADAQEDDIISVNGEKYLVTADDILAGEMIVSVVVREGQNKIVITSTDAFGEVERVEKVFTVDTQTVTPQISEVETTGTTGLIYPQDFFINADEQQQAIVIKGTAEAGAEVTVEVAGLNQPLTVTADPQGNWNVSIDPSDLATLADGALDISVQAVDAAGNVSDTLAYSAYTLDKTAPDLGLSISEDGIVSFNPSEVLYVLDGQGQPQIATLTDLANLLDSNEGTFAVEQNQLGDDVIVFKPNTPDFYGQVQIVVEDGVIADEAGNFSPQVTVVNPLVNLTLPPGVTITSDSYTVKAGETTTITFTFSELVAGFDASDIRVVGGQLTALKQDVTNPLIYTATFTPNATSDLKDVEITVPANSYVSVGTGKAGLEGQLDQDITGDTAAPAQATLTLVDDTNIVGDGVTSNGTIKVSGLEEGAAYEYSVDGGLTFTSFTASTVMPTEAEFTIAVDGVYPIGQVQVKQTDASGNSSISTLDQVVVLDKVMSEVTIVSIATDNQLHAAEISQGFDVVGTAEPFSTITLEINGNVLNTNGRPVEAKADANGNWKITVPAGEVTTAANTFTAKATDLAGNVDYDTESTTADSSNTFITINALTTNKDDIVNAAEFGSLTISGGAQGTLTNGTLYGEIIAANGDRYVLSGSNWVKPAISSGSGTGQYIYSSSGATSWTSTLPLNTPEFADGTYTIKMRLSSSSNITAERTFIVDTKVDAPEYAILNDDGTAIVGITNDSTPTWSNTGKAPAEPGSTIEVTANGYVLGSAVVDAAGNWSIPANKALPDGEYLIEVTITDKVGNTNSAATEFLVIDTVAPELSIDTVSGDGVLTDVELANGLTISGQATGAEDGRPVTVTIGALVKNAVVTNGQWSVQISDTELSGLGLSPNTNFTVEAEVADKAGNKATETQTVYFKDADRDTASQVVNMDEADLINTAVTEVKGSGVFAKPQATYTDIYLQAPNQELTSNGQKIVWESVNQQLIGRANGQEVIVVNIQKDGTYDVTLKQPLDHGAQGSSTDNKLGFDIRMNFADARGTTVESQYISVVLTDDQPEAKANKVHDLGTSTYQINDGLVVDYGADGGFVKSVALNGVTFVFDPQANTVTQMGTSSNIISYAYNNKGLEDGQLMVTTATGETLVVNLVTGQYQYDVQVFDANTYTASSPVGVSIGGDSSLLGILDLNVAGLIAMENQQLLTVQGEGIYEVEAIMSGLDLGALLGLILTGDPKKFTFDENLAREFGLDVNSTIKDGALNLSIKSDPAGEELDAFQVNQLLSTVSIDGGLTGTLNLSVLPGISIEAKDANGQRLAYKAQVEVAEVGLLNDLLKGDVDNTQQIDQIGLDNTLVVKNSKVSNSLYGLDGIDTLVGGLGSDILYGGTGNDTLTGNAGNDVLVGGQGNDTLIGGTGADIFRWEKDDYLMNKVTIARDTIKDFDIRPQAFGGDVLDLANLLQGEGYQGFGAGNLTNYLHFEYDAVANKTVLYINTKGEFVGGFNAAVHTAKVEQIIDLIGVNLTEGFTSDYHLISSLIGQGKLLTDALPIQTNTGSGAQTVVDFTISDNDGDTASTKVTFDREDLQSVIFDPLNQAPFVFGQDTSLLGLVGVDLLHILDLGNQDLAVYDVDNNLSEVSITFAQGVSLNVTNPAFKWSERLEQELGLDVVQTTTDGLANLVGKTTTITITSASNTDRKISNEAINQLLATLQFGSQDGALGLLDGNLLSLDVLNAMTITATDSQNVSTSQSLGKLVDLSLITGNSLNGAVNLVEGNDAPTETINRSTEIKDLLIYGYDGEDIISSGSGNDVIYGGEGMDTIKGGSGDDYLNGGAGNDTLYGDIGNDVLVGGAGNDFLYGGTGNNIFNGGEGRDTFISTVGGGRDTAIYDVLNAADATGGHDQDLWKNFAKGDVNTSADADVIDISALLADQKSEGGSIDLAKFVSVEVKDGHTIISIDRDGETVVDDSGKAISGNQYAMTELLTLNNVETTLADLLKNNQIIY